MVLLRHQHHLAAQQLRRQVGDRHPAHRHRSGPWPVDAREQPAQCRLPGA